jgi:hypothetical protein
MMGAVQSWTNQELSGKVGSGYEEGHGSADEDLLEPVFIFAIFYFKR